MFKDINYFEDTPKNAFLNKPSSGPKIQAEDILRAPTPELTEAPKSGPEGLRKEAKNAIKAIEKDLKQIEDRYKIKLDRKNAYGSEKTLEGYDKSLKDSIVSLVKGMQEFQEIAKSKTPSRTQLDIAHLSLNSGRTALKAHFALTKAEYDPMSFQSEHAYFNVDRAQAEEKPSRKESVEASSWSKLATKTEKLALLDRSNDAGEELALELKAEIKDLADEVMVGKNKDKITVGNMTIERAKGSGTQTAGFKITMEHLHDGHTKRIETVYAGISKAQFDEAESKFEKTS